MSGTNTAWWAAIERYQVLASDIGVRQARVNGRSVLVAEGGGRRFVVNDEPIGRPVLALSVLETLGRDLESTRRTR